LIGATMLVRLAAAGRETWEADKHGKPAAFVGTCKTAEKIMVFSHNFAYFVYSAANT